MQNTTFPTKITIPLCPYTKKNSQNIFYKTSSSGKKVPFIVPSANYRQYEKDASFFLKPLQIDVPVNVKALFYLPTKRKVDLTNLNEALHDIMVKSRTLVDDNAKIIVSTDGSRVFYDKKNPRTEILIEREEATFE